MRLSTQTNFYVKNFGYLNGINRLSKLGYDCLDLTLWHLGQSQDDPLLSDDFANTAKKIKETAQKNGVTFNQCHAPYAFADRSFFTNPKAKEDMLFRLNRSIAIAGIIGAENIVVHPLHGSRYLDKTREQILKLNTSFYGELVPAAKKAGVKIAVENMWRYNPENHQILPDTCADPNELALYVDTLNNTFGNYFVACLDIGHCILTGFSPEYCINVLGDRLKATHFHDNDAVTDSHTLPFTQKIKFEPIMKALKNINYQGDLTFEADKFLSGFPLEFCDTAAEFMLKTGRFLINL